jgi:hypothetical protein
MVLTFRCVLAPGDGMMSVVAAVVIEGVFCLPGVIVVPLISTHEAWTSISPADPVISCSLSLVLVRLIIFRLSEWVLAIGRAEDIHWDMDINRVQKRWIGEGVIGVPAVPEYPALHQ